MCQADLRFAALHQSHSVPSLGIKTESFGICVQRTAKLMQRLNWPQQHETANLETGIIV